MKLFVTGGTGALGTALLPAAEAAGHEVVAPRHAELDLFDPAAVAEATRGADAILHLATRIPSLDKLEDLPAWRENDRLRTEGSHTLVDVALADGVVTYIQPSIAFLDGLEEIPPTMRSAVDSEREAERFAAAGRRGVVLRLGLLDGPGTGHDEPLPTFGSTVHVADVADAMLAALELPSGTYNVCRDGEAVSNRRLKEVSHWRPRR
jgi:nucleoside-diphosphate-sugar epimerase